MTDLSESVRASDAATGSYPTVRLVAGALLAILGPWVVGMVLTFWSPTGRWSVDGGGGFFLGFLYLGGFGWGAARLAGRQHLLVGALAGEAFAIGSLGNPGFVFGIVMSVGAGMLGGLVARGAAREGIAGPSVDRAESDLLDDPTEDAGERRLPSGGRGLLGWLAVLCGIPIVLFLVGQMVFGAVFAVLVCAAAVVWLWVPIRAEGARPLTALALAVAVAFGISAWAADVSATRAEAIANKPTPLEQAVGLQRADGMSYGEFVQARYARQMGCEGLPEAVGSFSVLQQGPVRQGDGRSVLFHEVLFAASSSEASGCPSIGSFFVAVVAEEVPRTEYSEVLVRDCSTQRRMGRVWPDSSCSEPISELPKHFLTGPLPAVDWLTDFRAGSAP